MMTMWWSKERMNKKRPVSIFRCATSNLIPTRLLPWKTHWFRADIEVEKGDINVRIYFHSKKANKDFWYINMPCFISFFHAKTGLLMTRCTALNTNDSLLRFVRTSPDVRSTNTSFDFLWKRLHFCTEFGSGESHGFSSRKTSCSVADTFEGFLEITPL